MVGWHHQLKEYEFEQAPGAGDGQGSLACCSPWSRKESDTTEQLNWNGRNQDNIVKQLYPNFKIFIGLFELPISSCVTFSCGFFIWLKI